MAFSEKVQIVLEVVNDKATAALNKVSTSTGEAEKAQGKFKAALSGVSDAVGSAASALLSPAGLVAGAGAAVAIAGKAVGQFEDLGLSIGKVSDATGLSAEQASRWVEVANDAGVSTESFSGSLGKMEKAAANTPKVFDDLGISIAKTATGAVDVNKTFLNAIDTINAIKDPNEKAAAATKVFGKSWQDMAELIGRGSGQLSKDLAAVQPSKIFTNADVKSARDVRDGFDAISDAGEGLFLTLGRSLAPTVAKIAPQIGAMVSKAEPLIAELGDSFAELADQLGPVIGSISSLTTEMQKLGLTKSGLTIVSDGLEKVGLSVDDLSLGAIPALQAATEGLTKTTLEGSVASESSIANLTRSRTLEAQAAKYQADQQAKAAKVTAKAFDDTADSLQDWTDKTAKALTAVDAYTDAVTGTDWGKAQIDAADKAMSEFTDQHFKATDAESDYQDSLATTVETLKKNKLNFDLSTDAGRENQSAVEDLSRTLDTKFAQAYKDAHGDLDTFKSKSNDIANVVLTNLSNQLGLSEDDTKALAGQLGLLPEDIVTRYNLSGDEEAKIKIGLLQSAIDNLPEDVQTNVTQHILLGDYKGALDVVQNYLSNNPVTGKIVWQNVGLAAAIGAAAGAAKVPGKTPQGATGGIVTQPTLALIGEAGPEAVVPLNRTPGSSPLPTGLGGGNTYVTNVQMPQGFSDITALSALNRQATRRGKR
jgi:hypothetical protein